MFLIFNKQNIVFINFLFIIHLGLISGTKIFHQECRFWRIYSIGGESAFGDESSNSLSSMDDILFGFVEFLRRRRSSLVCQADERRRLSLSGVDVNRFCFGEDEIGSFSSLPFTSSSAKSQNFGVSTLFCDWRKEVSPN